MSKLRKLAVLLAFLLLGYSWYIWYQNLSSPRGVADPRNNVLEIPIEMKDGFSVSNVFELDSDVAYWLRIECEKTLPTKVMAEALTNEFVGEFVITRKKLVIAEGYTGTHTRDYGVVQLADAIKGSTGDEYCLRFQVIRSSPALATTNPKLRISTNLGALKNMGIAAALSKHKRFGAILVGICLVLSFAYSWFRIPNGTKTKLFL